MVEFYISPIRTCLDILNSPFPTANGPNEMVYFANSPTLYGFFGKKRNI